MNTSHSKKDIPLFHATYDIFIGPDHRCIQDHINETYPSLNFELPANATGYTSLISCPVAGKGVIVVLNAFLTEDIEMNNTIYHEAVHITWMTLEALGIKITYDNHEIQAYLMENIINNLKDAYEEYLKSNEDLPDL